MKKREAESVELELGGVYDKAYQVQVINSYKLKAHSMWSDEVVGRQGGHQ